MQVAIENLGPCERKVSVVVPVDQVNRVFDQTLQRIARNARIPGFRQGKAPRNALEAHYGSQIQQEVESKLVEETLFKAMNDSQLAPVTTPKVASGECTRNAEFSYTADVEIMPEIPLQKHEQLPVAKVVAGVTEADVDQQLDMMRQRASQVVPVLDRTDVQAGDCVVVDVAVTQDGNAVTSETKSNILFQLDAQGAAQHQLPASLASQLIGCVVPSTHAIDVTVAEGEQPAHLVGQSLTYLISMNELKTRKVPALDDEFAQDVGEESLVELRDKVRTHLLSQREQQATTETRKRLLKALVDANPFPVPHSLVTAQAARLVADTQRRMQEMFGRKFDLPQHMMVELLKESEGEAELQVRSALLLREVAKFAQLEVTQDEVDAEVAKALEQYGDRKESVRHMFAAAEVQDQIRRALLDDKAVAYLLERSVDAPSEVGSTQQPA